MRRLPLSFPTDELIAHLLPGYACGPFPYLEDPRQARCVIFPAPDLGIRSFPSIIRPSIAMTPHADRGSLLRRRTARFLYDCCCAARSVCRWNKRFAFVPGQAVGPQALGLLRSPGLVSGQWLIGK